MLLFVVQIEPSNQQTNIAMSTASLLVLLKITHSDQYS